MYNLIINASLWQAVNLAKSKFKKVNLVCANRLSFAPRDVDDVEILSENEITIKSSYLGWYSTDSILPSYFLLEVFNDKQDAIILRAFFDIFNKYLCGLAYKVWLCGKFIVEESRNQAQYRMFSNTFVEPVLARHSSFVAADVGFLTASIKSAFGLKLFLQSLINCEVIILQNQVSWLNVPHNKLLCLGDDAFLGARLLSLCHRLEIHFIIDSTEVWHMFCVKKLINRIREILKIVLPMELDVVLKVVCKIKDKLALGLFVLPLGCNYAL